MVPPHHAVHACPCLSHGLANTEPDARDCGEPGEKKLEAVPATHPLPEPECLQTSAGAGLPVMVPLSVPEIRRLFFFLVVSKPLSALFRLGWSFFRRSHQAIARRCHYKRRLASST